MTTQDKVGQQTAGRPGPTRNRAAELRAYLLTALDRDPHFTAEDTVNTVLTVLARHGDTEHRWRAEDLVSTALSASMSGWWRRRRRAELLAAAQVHATLARGVDGGEVT